MRHRFFSSSGSTRGEVILVLVLVAAMIGIGAVLMRRETWRGETHANPARPPEPQADEMRGETHPDAARPPEPQTDEMTKITQCLSAMRGEGAGKGPLPLRHHPLLRWSEPDQNVSEAAILALGERGRPSALVALERSANSGGRDGLGTWSIELISLANEPLLVDASNDNRAINVPSAASSKPVLATAIHWTPKSRGVSFQDIPDAPTPAPTATERLAQMNDLIKRFSAVVNQGGGPLDLRLVSDPIDRYSNLDAGQLDGAIFSFSLGTNPEAILLLRAQGQAPEKASWRFAAARATVATVEVALDGKVVSPFRYHSDKDNTPDSSYFAIGMPRLKP